MLLDCDDAACAPETEARLEDCDLPLRLDAVPWAVETIDNSSSFVTLGHSNVRF